MMLNFVSPRIKTFLPSAIGNQRRLGIYRSTDLHFCRWLQYVSLNMQLPLPLSESYPWCFVSPAYTINQQHFIMGAFLPAWQIIKNRPGALYVIIRKENVIRLLQHAGNETLPFFMMRILALLDARGEQEEYKKNIYSWLLRLQCMLPKMRCSRQLIYVNGRRWEIDSLRLQLCDFDFRYQSEDGVEVMPWLDWPNCILSQKKIWLWRQKRDGKILDLQKLDWPDEKKS
ncbi:hypothetical protein SAMN05216516_110122 [Izhakiella capsodis]|uniref:Uncharacterized protein n=1 Tax=Izhakiella capsodis TaxID=1367852 RepID=A0A1I5A384_9GAMM|nr:hypothetical protein [Izhakiella capsodis]SFN56847.1 hypothetical protein SAMN05216516_110122 [Izhakiella capsodis]